VLNPSAELAVLSVHFDYSATMLHFIFSIFIRLSGSSLEFPSPILSRDIKNGIASLERLSTNQSFEQHCYNNSIQNSRKLSVNVETNYKCLLA
jgi:hypothetical protein